MKLEGGTVIHQIPFNISVNLNLVISINLNTITYVDLNMVISLNLNMVICVIYCEHGDFRVSMIWLWRRAYATVDSECTNGFAIVRHLINIHAVDHAMLRSNTVAAVEIFSTANLKP